MNYISDRKRENRNYFWKGAMSATVFWVAVFGMTVLTATAYYIPSKVEQKVRAIREAEAPIRVETPAAAVPTPEPKVVAKPSYGVFQVQTVPSTYTVSTGVSQASIDWQKDHDECVRLQISKGEIARGAKADQVRNCVTAEMADIRAKISNNTATPSMRAELSNAVRLGY